MESKLNFLSCTQTSNNIFKYFQLNNENLSVARKNKT